MPEPLGFDAFKLDLQATAGTELNLAMELARSDRRGGGAEAGGFDP